MVPKRGQTFAYWFHRATVVGLPANALVVPLTELLMPAAVIAVATAYFGMWLAKAPALITALAFHTPFIKPVAPQTMCASGK